MRTESNERSASRRWAPRFVGAALLVGFAVLGTVGCTSHATAICESGLVCPPGTSCAADQDVCIRGSCGNGVVDAGEVCDDGNVRNGDNCSATCLSTEDCGNGILDPGEICDDGNTEGGDGCAADCFSDEACGNGRIDEEIGEVCDDGNNQDGDGCSASCRSDETCGNAIVDRVNGEICDDGNRTNDDDCSNDCTSTLDCGNGIVDVENGEECDDANADNTDDCVIHPERLCKKAICGDGWVLRGVEECDGNGQGKGGETADCNADCTTSSCGDGVVNLTADEECDDGAKNGTYNHCASNCTETGAACGDGHKNGPEVCDPLHPATQSITGTDDVAVDCNADCSGYPAYCGDGARNAEGEACDDGRANGRYNGLCNETCTGLPIRCGDGIVHDGGSGSGHGPDHGEACDLGAASNTGAYGTCTPQCMLAGRCGDNALQAADGETCEPSVDALRPSNGATCRSSSCTYCGDGVVQPGAGETCETDEAHRPWNNAECRWNTCTYCGDTVRQTGEGCDDGENNSDNVPGRCRTDCSGYVPPAQ